MNKISSKAEVSSSVDLSAPQTPKLALVQHVTAVLKKNNNNNEQKKNYQTD